MDACGEFLVTHEDGLRSCLDPACDAPDPVLHEWRADCADLLQACVDCPPALPDRQWRAA